MRTSLLTLSATLFLAAMSFAQPGTLTKEETLAKARPIFKEGNDFMRAKNYGEAAKRYEEVLKLLPDDTSAIFNTASAQRLRGNTSRAVVLFKKLKEMEPGSLAPRERLIQIYQSTDQITERDRERKELIEARRSGLHRALSEERRYVRDRFHVGGRQMWAYEYFDLAGSVGLKYDFENDDSEIAGPNTSVYLSVRSPDEVQQSWLATVSPKPAAGVRLFQLTGKVGEKAVESQNFAGEPSYDDVRKVVVEILNKYPAAK